MITPQKGRYEALELIGSGTTSRVEKARDNVIGRTVALKTFIYAFGEDLEQQFLREAQLVGQLSHPAIVQLYDVGIDQHATPFLVMEYIAGETLQSHLESSTLTIPRACAWAVELAGALATAHRAGIVHGDVKPGNIFINPEKRVRLGDFGIARLTSQLSPTGRVVGTPAYIAPEQIESGLQDHRSDQFSFGVVFYQMLTGFRPFDGKSVGAVCAQILNDNPLPPSSHNPAIPPALDRVVARCLAKNPQDRFASCEELAKSLYPFTRSRPKPSALPVKHRSWWSAPARHREVWIAASACLLLAALIQIPHLLSARYGIPPAPTRQYFYPGVPYEALSYSRQTVAQISEPAASSDSVPPAENKNTSSRTIHVEKITLAGFNKPAASHYLSADSATTARSPQ